MPTACSSASASRRARGILTPPLIARSMRARVIECVAAELEVEVGARAAVGHRAGTRAGQRRILLGLVTAHAHDDVRARVTARAGERQLRRAGVGPREAARAVRRALG